MALLASWSFQACNNEARKEDSVENAKESNDDLSTVEDNDAKFMVEAASGGMMEVALGQMAQQKARDQRVKDFGAMMVRDHTKANDELKALAASRNVSLPTTVGEDHQKHIHDLEQKTGADFDKDYMSMMVDDHEKDIKQFENTSDKGNDANLKAFASKTLPVLHVHLDSAKAVNDWLKK